MRKSIGYTTAALDAVALIDSTRSDEDRAFFAEQRASLEPIAAALAEADNAMTAFELGTGLSNQVKVAMGDALMDDAIRVAKARTRLELRNKSGFGVSHVFGNDLDDLVRMAMRREPAALVEAAGRLDDVPDFVGKTETKGQLLQWAETQEGLLDQRDAGYGERDRLRSSVVVKVAEASDALIRVEAALRGRFPRQRRFCKTFFLPSKRRRRPVETTEVDPE